MAEILGLGITHYPSFLPRIARPSSLLRLLQDPGLPERLRSPQAWPATMRDEWSDDGGAAFSERHRRDVVAAIRKARDALDTFQPDFIVIWGDDQYENFQEDVIPGFCLLAYDKVEFRPWEESSERGNAWDEPSDTVFRVNGHRQGAKYLARHLIERDFDVAYSYKPLHTPMGHAFANSVLFLDWDRKGFDFPIVPFTVNCFGRRIIATHGYMESLKAPIPESEFDPPSPSPARCFDLGAACARVLSESPWRVALIASSSWSHAFLTRKNTFLYPDSDADRILYDALLAGDYRVWRDTRLASVEESGQHELLNWFCLAGAMSELNRRPTYAKLFETCIMNSNKVVATFVP